MDRQLDYSYSQDQDAILLATTHHHRFKRFVTALLLMAADMDAAMDQHEREMRVLQMRKQITVVHPLSD